MSHMHWGNLFSTTCNSATILSQSLCDTLSNNLAQAKVHRKGTLKCDQKACCSGVCGFQDGTQTLEVGGGHRGGRRGLLYLAWQQVCAAEQVMVLRPNPSGNWIISIFLGQKPSTRIIYIISHFFLHNFSRAIDIINIIYL